MRLWFAMLGLAIVPMVGVILLESAFVAQRDQPATPTQAWSTSVAAADLTSLERQLEARILGVAADSAILKLVDGISGNTERQTAARAIASIEGTDRGLVRGACIVRTSTRVKTAIGGSAPGAVPSTGCGSPAIVARAMAQPPGTVVRSTAWGSGRARRLLLTTELPGTNRRNAGVLTVEIGLRELFAATRSVSDAASAALLVDMSSKEILASIRAAGISDGSASPAGRPLGDLRVRVSGIISGHDGTAKALAGAGWVSTAAPLWRATDGAHLGIVHFWPQPELAPSNALLASLIVFALVVLVIAILTARHFLQPFDDLAASQAQLEVLYREAREDSLHDALTGLGNHRSFQEELDRQIDLFNRHQVPVALLLIDLDDLKVVNDGEGHPAGDRLLVGMANAIRDALRYGDRAFRIGGDEFAVILPHTDSDEALVAANRLRHFCLRPAAGERVIPFSGGVSAVPSPAAGRAEIFKQADAALYRCKRQGRGTIAIFDADRDLVPQEADGIGAVTAVRDVVRTRNLTPVYQPIVDLRLGNVLGYEGLIRPGQSSPFSNPGQLFAAAAAGGRTVELDLACFDVVAAGARELGLDKVMTINLSPRTLESQDHSAGWLLEILTRNEISPGRVIVEMTEREDILDIDRLRTNVASLQHAGIRLAADDVGAGNAGLRLLSQVRFDIVKIDLSLVQEGAQSDSSRAVVRSLMELASRQGAVAIAEGVETAEQLNVLRELGITTAQGYLLGRPGPGLEISSVDIEALAAGTLFVQGKTASHDVASPDGATLAVAGPGVIGPAPLGDPEATKTDGLLGSPA